MIKRVAVLIGIFSSNVVQLAIYHNNDTNLTILRIILLLVSVIAFVPLLTDRCLSLSIHFCDAAIFGVGIGWIIVVAFEGIAHYIVFMAVNIALLVGLVITDIFFHCKKTMSDDENEYGDNPHGQARDIEMPNITESVPKHSESKSGDDIIAGSKANSPSSSQGKQGEEKMNHHPPEPIRIRGPNSFDGFRVRLSSLPVGELSPLCVNLSWSEFTDVEHRIDSTSCHIYSAFWKTSPVILKLIKADRVHSAQSVGEFETEAHVLSRIKHPHIIKLLGAGTNPRPFLVLELLDGGSLSHTLGLRADENNRINKKVIIYSFFEITDIHS